MTIHYRIEKEQEGSYFTIPFEVPAGFDRIDVTYSFPRLSGAALCVVDLGLMDGEGRFLGWSGSARKSVFVSERDATPGYMMTPVTAGTWRLIAGAYRIPQGGLTVTYDITFTKGAARWLSGDLHVHSSASDGQHTVPELARMAKKAGLDFLAVSDHNNCCENDNLPRIAGLTLIPAVEWTHYMGHMNLFGAANPFDNSFVANSLEEMRALVRRAKELGALASVNHPKCPLCPWLWDDDDIFDMVEVWNGPMRKANTDAVKSWHSLLCSGRRIPAVGGSDFHRDRRVVRFAHPVTRVFSESGSAADILDALRAGRSYITGSVKGPAAELRCGKAMMGDMAAGDGDTLSFSLTGLPPLSRVSLVTREGTAFTGFCAAGGEVSGCVPVCESRRFAYLTVTRAKRILLITNPIYFEGRE